MQGELPVDYSIIIYNHNTDERILNRCLAAVVALDRDGLVTEVLFVDNNHLTPAESLGFVRQFFSKIPNMRGVIIPQEGVKYAAAEAIEKASGKYIVYIDADNEPERDYLQELKRLNAQVEQVGAWGPGNVTVQFIDNVDKHLEEFARMAFRERHEDTLKTAHLMEWQPFYPFGPGLCILSGILKEYVALTKKGRLTSEAKRKIIPGGEDVQIVMLCIKKGYHAGISPALKLNHLIPKEKSSKEYLKKLVFSGAFCFEPALLNVLPERKNILKKKIISPLLFSAKAAKELMAAKFGKPIKFFGAVHFIGSQAGIYQSLEKPLPRFIKKMIATLRLK